MKLKNIIYSNIKKQQISRIKSNRRSPVYLYSEKYQTLLRRIKGERNVYRLEDSILLKLTIAMNKLVYRLNVSTVKILAGFVHVCKLTI